MLKFVYTICENGHKVRHEGSNRKRSGKGLQIPKLCVRCNGKINEIIDVN